MEAITSDEKAQMRRLLVRLYGPAASDWAVTLRTYEVLERLLAKTSYCSDYMDWVPRPYAGGNAIKWTVRQVRQAILRQLLRPSRQVYIVCLKGAALSLKADFRLAGRP